MVMLILGFIAIDCAYAEKAASKNTVKNFDMKQVDRGRYLSRIAGCNDCHTPGYLLSEGKVQEKLWLTGARFGWRGPWGTTYAFNLRTLLNSMTEDQWVTFAQKIKARPPMPWYDLNIMKEGDVKAIYQFIRYLGPSGEAAPSFVPPDQEPRTPYALFPSPPQKGRQ